MFASLFERRIEMHRKPSNRNIDRIKVAIISFVIMCGIATVSCLAYVGLTNDTHVRQAPALPGCILDDDDPMDVPCVIVEGCKMTIITGTMPENMLNVALGGKEREGGCETKGLNSQPYSYRVQ